MNPIRCVYQTARALWSRQDPHAQGEAPLRAFISSVMTSELEWARKEATRALHIPGLVLPWAFEFTPASSEQVDKGYLRHVRESELVIWLVGSTTSDPVCDEVHEALASQRRLLIFLLPAPAKDTRTENLLREVGRRAKYATLGNTSELRPHLVAAFKDEVIRAFRGRSSLGRTGLLEAAYVESRARCIDRWVSAGVPFDLAADLADDERVASVGTQLCRDGRQGLITLSGGMGVGKSLTADRFFQEAVRQALEGKSTRVPVYLQAAAITGDLKTALLAGTQGIGNPTLQGTSAVLDGLDDVDQPTAHNVLSQARVLSLSLPNSAFLLASHNGISVDDVESVTVHPLDDADSAALFSRISGLRTFPIDRLRWPSSIKDVVSRPLFTILLGIYLRDRHQEPHSDGELVAFLVERSLAHASRPARDVAPLLERLAVHNIDRGGAIPLPECGTPEDVVLMISTRLVAQNADGSLYFPLRLFAEWFAAKALTDRVTVGGLSHTPRQLDRWSGPLTVATSSFSHDDVTRILRPVIERDPGMGALVAHDAIGSWRLNVEAASPPAEEAERRLKETMGAWLAGLGPLGSLIGPVDPKGDVHVTARDEGKWLHTEWTYWSSSGVRKVVQSARPGHQSAWAWRWTLERLRQELESMLAARALPTKNQAIIHEAAWELALKLTGRGSLNSAAIPLADIESGLREIRKVASRLSRRMDLNRWIEFGALVERCQTLRSGGVNVLDAPWPGPDLLGASGQPGLGWIWDPYSPEQLLQRARAVYLGAITAYEQLVQEWFSPFAGRLSVAALMPVCLLGRLKMPVAGQGSIGPTMIWRLEPISEEPHLVDIKFGTEEDQARFIEDFHRLIANTNSLRPRLLGANRFQYHNGTVPIFGTRPATDIAYQWLWDDLKELHWVEGIFSPRPE